MPKGYARKDVGEDGTVRHYNEEWQLHREDGPALEWADGTKEWRENGKLHCESGPAIERPDGTKEYWLSGKQMTESEFRALHPEVEEESPGPGH